MLGDIVENSRQLFITPILRFTIISIVINFTFHIGYYGLMMWFPELFNRFDEFHRDQPGMVASICQVTDYVVNKGSHSVESVCTDKIGASVFMESLITVASAIPANIIAVLGMDRLGRKFFLGSRYSITIKKIKAMKIFYIFILFIFIFIYFIIYILSLITISLIEYFFVQIIVLRAFLCSVQHILIRAVLDRFVFRVQQVSEFDGVGYL